MIATIVPARWPWNRLRSAITSRRIAVVALIVWAFWQGAHEHEPATTVDLTGVAAERTIVIDASTALLDLSGVTVTPGEVVDLLLAGTAGSPHQFVLTGAPAAEMDVLTAENGDTIIRLRVPEDGEVSFLCTVPGHEGLHGSLLVKIDE